MSKDIDELTKLNKDYVDSVQNSDVKRFDQILADDFYCTLPDKSFVDRAEFLRYTAIPVKIKNLTAQDVRIRVMGDSAIIHAHQLHHLRGSTSLGSLYRLLGQAERTLARGFGARFTVDSFRSAIRPLCELFLRIECMAESSLRRYRGAGRYDTAPQRKQNVKIISNETRLKKFLPRGAHFSLAANVVTF